MPAVAAQLDAFVSPVYSDARPARPGFFRLVLDAMMESRQRQADREVARLIELGGGRITDSLERRIERHFV